MSRDVNWRVISDYIGTGSFVLSSSAVTVGTDSGVQCVERERQERPLWSADLGSRCIGVRKVDKGMLLATCREGMFLLTGKGKVEREKLFAGSLVSEALPFGEGTLLIVGTGLHCYHQWVGPPAWIYDFKEALGSSVESIRPIHVFECGGKIVAGVVDYDSGVGRVVVLGPDGEPSWLSEPGPLSEVFPAGSDLFVWCLTGYGKFESHLTRLDGSQVWKTKFAGVGAPKKDGSIAMVIGTNESPEWDHWQYRQITPSGKIEIELKGKGRAPVRPCTGEDGSVYFLGYVLYLDPNSSRVDYTNFFAMPQELLFQHLVGIRIQIPEYDIYLQKLDGRKGTLEVIHEISGSYSLAAPQILGDEVVFCDGTDIVAVSK